DPTNIVEVGRFDTSPLTGDGFDGAWGVYPFLPSGRLLVSDIQEGLFILEPTYVQACLLQGLISDANTSAPVNGATVTLDGTTASDLTDGFDGQYATGWATAGTYSVTVSAPGYVGQTVPGVVLTNGSVTTQDVELVPLTPFNVAGTVIEAGTGTPVAAATVVLSNETYQFSATTDANGQFSIPNAFAGDYQGLAGHWGHHTVCTEVPGLAQGSPAITFELPAGYADDFALDLGWTATSEASSGDWVREAPVGTSFFQQAVAPGADMTDDCGELAYVTGNGGGEAGDDDVDQGTVELASPAFDATLTTDPWIRYYRWWYTGGGNSDSNDELVIKLDNGGDLFTVETLDLDAPDQAAWVMHQFRIADLTTPTANMRLIVSTGDDDPGHLVEAGLDRFEVLPESPFLTVPETAPQDMLLFPDPSDGACTLLAPGISGRVRVLDARGRQVLAPVRFKGGSLALRIDAGAGLYLVRIDQDNGAVRTLRMVVR
ncbi:MAG TPA: carboxypeptidase regulatory-like domain-containing protein, partial [Flavobacteriales bacterium]|nr:carboxypeptidase regulatory-like domain-containing protein [Flavobacteriales bacterium]